MTQTKPEIYLHQTCPEGPSAISASVSKGFHAVRTVFSFAQEEARSHFGQNICDSVTYNFSSSAITGASFLCKRLLESKIKKINMKNFDNLTPLTEMM